MSVARLAERVAETWYGAGRPGDDAEMVGVIAGLCLLVWPSYIGPEAKQAETLVAGAADDQIADLLAQAWATFWAIRPELAFRCGPFASWLNAEPRDHQRVRAAAQVARAAIKAGLWTGRYGDQDVIGTVYTLGARSTKARQARGEFYTPLSVCRTMAEMTLTGTKAERGQSICDPCAGTGGMFYGAAEALRGGGEDPADFWWYGNDISPVSVAGLCVNVHLWQLGRRVVIGCADSLAEPDWYVRAWDEQKTAVEQHAATVRIARMFALLRGDDPPAETEREPALPPEQPPAAEDGVLFVPDWPDVQPPEHPARQTRRQPARTPAAAADVRSRRLAAGTGMSPDRAASFLADVDRLIGNQDDQIPTLF